MVKLLTGTADTDTNSLKPNMSADFELFWLLSQVVILTHTGTGLTELLSNQGLQSLDPIGLGYSDDIVLGDT